MRIAEGLFDHMVLQRDAQDVCDAYFRGECIHDGLVRARVMHGGALVPGWAEAVVGKAGGGHFEGRLHGLPTGGPYTIELEFVDACGTVTENVFVHDVLVGDVWLLGGQSNMEGIGLLVDAARTREFVRAFYMDDRWDVAQDPVHNISDAVDPIHRRLCGGELPPAKTVTGVGPGVAFGQAMHEFSDVPQGLIACAHGGTSMSQWDPGRKAEGGNSLYGAMLRRFRKNGAKVAGLVWYQGCSDANPAAAPLYTDRMVKLIAAVRGDCGDPDLPVAVVQIARVVGWGADTVQHWNSVQDQQRRLPESIDRLLVVPAIDLPLDDGIHIAGIGQNRLGWRLARAMHALVGGNGAGPPPIEVRNVCVEESAAAPNADVIAEFAHVEGALRSGSRPAGFAIVGQGGVYDVVFDIRLDGCSVIVRTGVPPVNLKGKTLWYGYGTNPYCNITDANDRSLPVFRVRL